MIIEANEQQVKRVINTYVDTLVSEGHSRPLGLLRLIATQNEELIKQLASDPVKQPSVKKRLVLMKYEVVPKNWTGC